jgi:AcrR family transcriptional regulator
VRVTEKTKAATRRRILKSARTLFSREGFERTTTRDVAKAAAIATGTLFNYFATKEAIALGLVADAIEAAHQEFESLHRDRGSLEEDLFGFIAAELRHLKSHRGYVQPVLEIALSPLALLEKTGESLRLSHIERVERMIAARVSEGACSFVALHLYWTLYTGVLAFWAADESPNQEDTLAVLDSSLKAFVSVLPTPLVARNTANVSGELP